MNKVLINISSAEDALNTLPALPFNDREQLPGRAGIYIVTLLKEQILYIGKTKNFNTRWLAHHKLNEIKDGYGTDKILIAFCELSENEIDISEAALIKKFRPPLNIALVPKEVINQAQQWFGSENPKYTSIPRELRLWIHKNCNCTCQVCGCLVDDKRIGIIKYRDEDDGEPENLALICRSCRSRIRSNKSINSFRDNQKALLLRDLDKIRETVAFNFSRKCTAIDELEKFIHEQPIEFKNERN